MRTPAGFFVTGTDVSVGKTRVASALIRHLVQQDKRVAVMKPVAVGCTRRDGELHSIDAAALVAAGNVEATADDVSPYRFEAQIAPDRAAERANREIRIGPIMRAFARLSEAADLVVVEGSGGVMVPIGLDRTMADLIGALGLPALLVVGVRRGCINHALLSARAIDAHGVELAGWAANYAVPQNDDASGDIDSIARALGRPPVAIIPHQGDAAPGPPDLSFDSLFD